MGKENILVIEDEEVIRTELGSKQTPADSFDDDEEDGRSLKSMVARAIARLLGADAALAWACFRRRREVSTVFTDSERVGMLYAALTSLVRRRPRHVMIGHRLSAPKKLKMHKALRLGRRIDHVLIAPGTSGAHPTAARIVRDEPNGLPPSDHYPVVVDLEF